MAVFELCTSLPKQYHGHIARLLVHLDTHKHESVCVARSIHLTLYPTESIHGLCLQLQGYACCGVMLSTAALSAICPLLVLIRYSENTNQSGYCIQRLSVRLLQLVTLSLDNNTFTGPLPSSWSNLTRVSTMHIPVLWIFACTCLIA